MAASRIAMTEDFQRPRSGARPGRTGPTRRPYFMPIDDDPDPLHARARGGRSVGRFSFQCVFAGTNLSARPKPRQRDIVRRGTVHAHRVTAQAFFLVFAHVRAVQSVPSV